MSDTAAHFVTSVDLSGIPSTAPSDFGAFTRRLARGEDAAYRQFHADYYERLLRFLLVVTRGDSALAQDALQETFLRVARGARPFDSEEIFWCWLKAVARNAARDGGRRQTRYSALLARFTRHVQLDTTPETPLNGVLEECLAELPDDERQLVEAKYLDGESVRAMAAQTGLTEKAVDSRLVRLRRHLRERILNKLKNL